MALAPIKTRFFTFYSFKGGVGRSMALYNCACVLAGAGRRVLMIDFDLEAPGLTFLLQRRIAQKLKRAAGKKPIADALAKAQGLIELITQFVDDPKQWPLAKRDDTDVFADYVADLPIPTKVRVKGVEGRLALMPAGRIDGQFETRLGRVRWDAEPLSKLREHLFRHVREVIARSEQFDYVLIDARTGFSDEGYLCTRILADDLIVLSGLNDQNILGTSRFLKQVDAWQRKDPKRPRGIILIESPVPELQETELKRRHLAVRRLFKQHVGQNVKFTLALPYHPALALFEEVMVADRPDSTLAKAYRKLTHVLRALADDDAKRWAQEALDAVRRPLESADVRGGAPELHRVHSALQTLRSIDPRDFSQVAPTIANEVLRIDPPTPEAFDLLGFLAEAEPDEPLYHLMRARLLRRLPEAAQTGDALRELAKADGIARRTTNRNARLGIEIERGEIHEQRGQLNKAVDAFRQAGRHAKSTSDRDNLRRVSLDLARLFEKRSDHRAVKRYYRAVIEIDRKASNRENLAAALLSYGRYLRRAGQRLDARQSIDEGADLFRALGDRRGTAFALHERAVVDQEDGDHEGARKRFTEALEIHRSLGQRREISVTLDSLAELDQLQGDYERARKRLTEALEIDRALGDRRGIAVTLQSLAKLDRLQGDYEWARKRLTEALETYGSLGDRRGIALSLRLRANLDRLQGDEGQARRDYQESLKIMRSLDDRAGVAATLCSLADLDCSQGHYDRAREVFVESIEINRALGDRGAVAIISAKLADLDALQGDYHRARQEFSGALKVLRSMGDRPGVGAVLYHLARLDRYQCNYENARKGYTESLEIDRALGDRRGIAVTLHSLAELDRLQGNYEGARKGYMEALEIDRALGARRGIAVTELHLATTDALAEPDANGGPVSAALRAVEQIGDPYVLARGFLLLAEVHVAGEQRDPALESLEQALALCTKRGFRGLQAEARAMRAMLLDERGAAAAREHARQAISFFDKQSVRHPKRSELDAIAGSKSAARRSRPTT